MKFNDAKYGHDYICIHVDDFKSVARDADTWLQIISQIFLVKSHGPRNYYLSNDYTCHEKLDVWTYGGLIYT